MAQQQIITKPYVGELQDDDSLFINHDGALRQVKKKDTDFASSEYVRTYVDNATVASAQKATNDSDGNAINTTYRKVADSYNKSEIDTKLTGKADKATVVQTSLSSGGWSGGKYSFETQYPTNKYDITVEPDGDKITAEGYKAWGALNATGSINNVLIAKGKIPAVDIAVILRVVEKNA